MKKKKILQTIPKCNNQSNFMELRPIRIEAKKTVNA